jgi:hypothetical protein
LHLGVCWRGHDSCQQHAVAYVRSLATETAFESQRVRVHHYISQSRVKMESKAQRGDADVYRKRRDAVYWNNIEQHSNSQLDVTLARVSVCAGMKTTAEVRQLFNRSFSRTADRTPHVFPPSRLYHNQILVPAQVSRSLA